MEMDCLMDRMGSVPILSVKRTASIGTILNFDGDGDGDGTCKQTCTLDVCISKNGTVQMTEKRKHRH